MELSFRDTKGGVMPLFGNPYFTVTDIDGLTMADVAISSNVMSDMDGDIITSQTVNPRTVTITLRVNQNINTEECKRYVTSFVKLKQKGELYMDYRDRIVTLSGVIQSFNMPRFSNAVAIQFALYCSQPLWEDVQALSAMISEVVPLHHWEIIPKEDADIVMGEIMDTKKQTIVNNGDVPVGMRITIVALGAVSNPVIYRDGTEEFFKVNVTMSDRDELIISTVRGEKYVRLNDESIIEKVAEGSTWLQLEAGENDFVIDADSGVDSVQLTLVARERYI